MCFSTPLSYPPPHPTQGCFQRRWTHARVDTHTRATSESKWRSPQSQLKAKIIRRRNTENENRKRWIIERTLIFQTVLWLKNSPVIWLKIVIVQLSVASNAFRIHSNLSLGLLLLFIFQLDNSGSDDLTAIQNICTCFGIGGLYDPKKRYVTQALLKLRHDLTLT